MPKTELYPRPSTRAEDVLTYITGNEGTTTNGIIVGLKMNPSVVRKCLANLLERKLIEDRPDESKNHHYYRRKML